MGRNPKSKKMSRSNGWRGSRRFDPDDLTSPFRTMGAVGFRSPTPQSPRILRMGFLICPRRGNGELVLILLHLSVNQSPQAQKFENLTLTRKKPSPQIGIRRPLDEGRVLGWSHPITRERIQEDMIPWTSLLLDVRLRILEGGIWRDPIRPTSLLQGGTVLRRCHWIWRGRIRRESSHRTSLRLDGLFLPRRRLILEGRIWREMTPRIFLHLDWVGSVRQSLMLLMRLLGETFRLQGKIGRICLLWKQEEGLAWSLPRRLRKRSIRRRKRNCWGNSLI